MSYKKTVLYKKYIFIPVFVIVISLYFIGKSIVLYYERDIPTFNSDDSIAVLNNGGVGLNTGEEVSDDASYNIPVTPLPMPNGFKMIDINTATIEELMTLPDIGEKRAISIVEMRKKMGGFRSKDDLANAGGVGVNITKRISNMITVSELTDELKEKILNEDTVNIEDKKATPLPVSDGFKKVNINTASADELKKLPGIKDAKAREIITKREEIGGFNTIEELSKVSGISENTVEQLKNMICTE